MQLMMYCSACCALAVRLKRLINVPRFSSVLQTGRTPLHVAAFHGAPECVTALLEAGCDVELKDQVRLHVDSVVLQERY